MLGNANQCNVSTPRAMLSSAFSHQLIDQQQLTSELNIFFMSCLKKGDTKIRSCSQLSERSDFHANISDVDVQPPANVSIPRASVRAQIEWIDQNSLRRPANAATFIPGVAAADVNFSRVSTGFSVQIRWELLLCISRR